MAKVFLTSEASVHDHPFARRNFERLSYYSTVDKTNKHIVVDNPVDADIVVFVGSSSVNYSDIKSSRLYKEHRHKSVIFYSEDTGIPLIPGVYTCLENNLMTRSKKSVLSGFYLRVTDNDSLDIDDDINNANYLFSFIGNALNHSVRKNICQLSHSRSYLKDSSIDTRQQDDGIGGDNKERGILYRDVMAQSKFILCPRGVGVSSWRLFETMRAGRVPVIISDAWIPPIGPKWDSFALFIKENEVARLPELLEKNEYLAKSFSIIAREEWERWYSKEVVFTTTIDLLLLAHSNYSDEFWISRMLMYAQYLQPFYFRHWVLSPIKQRLFS